MKPAIVSIFSLVLTTLLSAECQPLVRTTGSQTFWKVFGDNYGAVRFPEELTVCTGRTYFFELKGGAKMQSALDRKRGRILRREAKLTYLMHELAHVYLDLRWKILPYSVSEPFVLAMADVTKCAPADMKENSTDLQSRWKSRTKLSRCGLLQLLQDLLHAEAAVRDSLPLN